MIRTFVLEKIHPYTHPDLYWARENLLGDRYSTECILDIELTEPLLWSSEVDVVVICL